MNREELIWASGLFEGEGCFYAHKTRNQVAPAAALQMTDEDTVRRFARAVGFGRVGGPYGPYGKGKGDWSAFWYWRVYGFEKVQALTALMWNGLGARRRQRATEVLRRTDNMGRRVR